MFASDIMTAPVKSIGPDATIEEADYAASVRARLAACP